MRQPKMRECIYCGTGFTPKPLYNNSILPKVCSPRCAIGYAREKEEKRVAQIIRKEKKKSLEKLMTHSDWLKVLQKVFNAYIRKRDEKETCISCGTTKGQMHAGHFRSVGSAPHLRFHELNVWKQCATCNNHLHGNLIEYRKRLVNKIGADQVEWLENYNETGKLSIPEIKDKIQEYKNKIKRL